MNKQARQRRAMVRAKTSRLVRKQRAHDRIQARLERLARAAGKDC